MNRVVFFFSIVFALCCLTAHAQEGVPPGFTDVAVQNMQAQLSQDTSLIGGGNADSSSTSSAGASAGSSSGANSGSSSNSGIEWNQTTVSDYENKTAPLMMYPPNLPYNQHGGWGVLNVSGVPNQDNGKFPQGYERTFDLSDPNTQKEIRGILWSLPYKGPLEVLAGTITGVFSPGTNHRFRGLSVIPPSFIRDKRPEGKRMYVLIDSNVDPRLLKEVGYMYVGSTGVTGEIRRNWDHAYLACVEEALPYDIDLLLVSGGVKGVTVSSNTTFPSSAAGYSQTNYSVSLFGAYAKGVTEGETKPIIYAAGYRLAPNMAASRKVPDNIRESIGCKSPPCNAAPPGMSSVPQRSANGNGSKEVIRVETQQPK